MRPYARGRAYDPDRFGGVTEYMDPGAPIDEQAVTEALIAKGALSEESVAEVENNEVVNQVELTEEVTVEETAAVEETVAAEEPEAETTEEEVEEI